MHPNVGQTSSWNNTTWQARHTTHLSASLFAVWPRVIVLLSLPESSVRAYWLRWMCESTGQTRNCEPLRCDPHCPVAVFHPLICQKILFPSTKWHKQHLSHKLNIIKYIHGKKKQKLFLSTLQRYTEQIRCIHLTPSHTANSVPTLTLTLTLQLWACLAAGGRTSAHLEMSYRY